MTRRTACRHVLAAATAAGMPSAFSFGSGLRSRRAKPVERLASGVEIWQVTTDELPHSNIYCEIPYCSADSRLFVYQRTSPIESRNRTELMVVELGTWKQHRLDTALGIGGSAISHDGLFYYLKGVAGDAVDLMRAELSSGSIQRVYQLQDGVQIRSLGTVSTDRRYYAGGTKVDQGWTMFDVLLVDLAQGTQRVIDRDPFILNPHPQFEPGQGRQLMIQHNRGGTYSAAGRLERLVGPEGATLYLLSVPAGQRTALQVGTPFTTPCTGHEAWIGDTGAMLLSVAASGQYAPERGNLLAVRAGQPPRVVAKGYRFNHVGVSRCGRLFACDDWQGTYKIVIGSTQTGKTAEVCPSKTVPSRSQNTHPHAYLTPDLKWVIFNSNRSGVPHIYAASVPESMVKELIPI
jgi:hypothetical protein